MYGAKTARKINLALVIVAVIGLPMKLWYLLVATIYGVTLARKNIAALVIVAVIGWRMKKCGL
jgi:hypothetical protein